MDTENSNSNRLIIKNFKFKAVTLSAPVWWKEVIMITFEEAKKFFHYEMEPLNEVAIVINRYMEEHSLYREDIEEGIKCSLL